MITIISLPIFQGLDPPIAWWSESVCPNFIRRPKLHEQTWLEKERLPNPSWANRIPPVKFWNTLKIRLWAAGISQMGPKFGTMKSQMEWWAGRSSEWWMERLAERYTGKSGREKTIPPSTAAGWLPDSYEVFLYFLSLGSGSFYDLEIDAIL